AAVEGDGRVVFDGGDLDARVRQSGDGGLAAGPGAADADLDLGDAVLLGLVGAFLGGAGGGEGGAFAAALEAHGARRPEAQRFAVHVGDGDLGVVERRLDVGDAPVDVLADFLLLLGHGDVSKLRALP